MRVACVCKEKINMAKCVTRVSTVLLVQPFCRTEIFQNKKEKLVFFLLFHKFEIYNNKSFKNEKQTA